MRADNPPSVAKYKIKSAMAPNSICLCITSMLDGSVTRMTVPKGFLVLSYKELISGASAQLASADNYDLVYQLSGDGTTSCISLSRQAAGGARLAVCDMYVLDRTVKYLEHSPDIEVTGMRHIANHIIKKKQIIYGVRFTPTVIPSYADVDKCRAVFESMRACKVYTPVQSVYETHGQSCFKTFNHFNCKAVSRILSSFPNQSLIFARGVCMNVASLHVSHAPWVEEHKLIVAHTFQEIYIKKNAYDALKKLSVSACVGTKKGGDTKTNVLTINTENGLYRTSLVSVENSIRQMLSECGVSTRSESSMYVCFNLNGSISLVADVDMNSPSIVVSHQSTPDMMRDDSMDGSLNRLRFINSACAYHRELRPLLSEMSTHWNSVESARNSNEYNNSVKLMLSKDNSPAIHALSSHDLSCD